MSKIKQDKLNDTLIRLRKQNKYLRTQLNGTTEKSIARFTQAELYKTILKDIHDTSVDLLAQNKNINLSWILSQTKRVWK